MAPAMKVVIASVPMNEKVVAEVYCDDEMWATVTYDQDPMLIEIYPCQSERFWRFPLDEVLNVLKLAQDRLMGRSP